MEIDFSLEDILDYFRQKGGKVIYTELVTHFKNALSNPDSQANARVLFKNYVNTLANVVHEDGKKYLILRSKFTKKLYETQEPSPITTPTTSLKQQQLLDSVISSNENSPNLNYSSKGFGLNNGDGIHDHHQQQQYEYHKNHRNHLINNMTSIINNDININYENNNNLMLQQHQQHLNNDTPPNTAMMMMNNINNNYYNNDNMIINNPNNRNINPTPTTIASQKITPPNNLRIIPTSSLPRQHNSYHHYQKTHTNVLPTINEINYINNNSSNSSSQSITTLNEDEKQLLDSSSPQVPPPRPPPRKKNSFNNKTIKPSITSAVLRNNSHNYDNNDEQIQIALMQHQQPNDIEQFESINTVKKEIQELAKTPGRVKEHSQIFNKLALDTKLPMPTTTTTNKTSTTSITNSVSQVVNSKVRNTATHSDTDSGSVHLTDPLKKRWIIASSDCDFPEMLSLLRQDPELSRYSDSIMGYTALHWAAKFNRPEIIKLIAGNFKADVNVKAFSGSTPLHIAAQFQNEDIMKILVYHYGASKEIRDNYGRKPYQYLEKKNNELQSNPIGNNSTENDQLQSNGNSNSATNSISAKDNLKNNLRNRISHQSMLVRNTLRNTKAFKRRKSMNEKSKQKNKSQNTT